MRVMRSLLMLFVCSFLCAPALWGQSCATLCGDVDNDGVFDISDIVYFNTWYATPGSPAPSQCANVNGCGSITGADLVFMAWAVQDIDHDFEDCNVTTACLSTPAGWVKLGCRPWEIYPGGDSVAIPVLVTTVAGVRGMSLGFSYASDNIRITSVDFSASELPLLLGTRRCLPDEKKVAIAAAIQGSGSTIYTDAVLCKLNARILNDDPLQLILLQPAVVSPVGDWLFVGDSKPYFRPSFYQGLCCFDCGDANGDGAIDISDAIALLEYIFAGGTAPGFCNYPFGKGDPNGDGGVDIADAVFIIWNIFHATWTGHCMGQD